MNFPTDNNKRVVFDEDLSSQSNYSYSSDNPKMVDFVINHSGGLIKNKPQAIRFLFAISIVFIILAIMFARHSNVKSRPPITPEEKSFMQTGHGLQ